MKRPSPVTGRRVRFGARQLVGLATERFLALIEPMEGDPSPVADGATVAEWARLAGLFEEAPHPHIQDRFIHPLHCGDNDPENIAHIALQRLTLRSIIHRRGGLPFTYRPAAS